MKLPQPITIAECGMRNEKPSPAAVAAPHSALRTPHFQRGMALIITLILLSITLIMAVAFLAIARRERNAVTTTTDTAIARLATDSALAAATAQMAANIFASTNLAAYDSHLLVSTNFINQLGYVPGSQSPTNVNYDYRFGGGALNGADLEQNVANLWLLPRAPVLASATEPLAGRFWLDLNRNGRFETNGVIQELDGLGNAIGTPFLHVGDPEWIGVLERPDQPHSANNRFVARYAFASQPIGNSLDLNYIHNQVLNQSLGVQDGYFRNQGVGSWELNLASFLADLNTNIWGQAVGSGLGAPVNASGFYLYNQALTGFANSGIAFDDARSLLSWRYNYNYNSLYSVSQLFLNATRFAGDGIDGYTDGKLQTTVDTNADFTADNPSLSWAGADSTNRFFALPSELFDPTKSSPNFYNRLASAGISNSTYDRYTFYRLLDQLGTGSTADSGKINLNYSNAVVAYGANGVVTSVSIVPGAETNLMRWNPLDFFHAAANQMLLAYTKAWFQANPKNFVATFYGTNLTGYLDANGVGVTNLQYAGQLNEIPAFGVTNIPVYVNGQFVYSPAVNRLLQLAANIYDATTNSPFPSVFRPIVSRIGSSVYIVSYTQVESVTGTGDLRYFTRPQDPIDFSISGGQNVSLNLYGVPWILGAKKGLPNFNLFSTVNASQITRKLQVNRNTTNITSSTFYWTNQQYVVGITNNMSISFWNSYETAYPRPVTIYAFDELLMTLTNGLRVLADTPSPQTFFIPSVTINPSAWTGSQWSQSGNPPTSTPQATSFYYTNWSYAFAPEAVYFPGNGQLTVNPTQPWGVNNDLSPFDKSGQLGLRTTNHLMVIMLDDTHVIDYVQLRGPSSTRNLSAELADPNYPDTKGPDPTRRLQWSANQMTAQPPTWGVMNQLAVSSQSSLAPGGNSWKRPPTMPSSIPSDPANPGLIESEFFSGFFTAFWFDSLNSKTYVNMARTVQAPYTPVRMIYNYTLWQANDPLVHYLASDLNYVDPGNVGFQTSDQPGSVPSSTTYVAQLGDRYQPWGRNTQIAKNSNVDTNAYNLRYRDPVVWGSDNWDFPTNPLPTVGWLGRVHRGTPWQTAYLKAHNVLHIPDLNTNSPGTGTNTWKAWVGEDNNVFDAANSAPLQDRLLFDLFTTRFNDNAVRGALSVNQTHLAAWSAVFSGMVALTNNLLDNAAVQGVVPSATSLIIDPAGTAGSGAPVGLLVSNINTARQTFTNADGLVGAFEHVGDILSVPALTETSQFLNTSTGSQVRHAISDELYEWLPQQTLGLLRVDDTPRFVVYCYGQTLKPARDSLVLDNSAGQFGLCTNYQVTAENAARAVIRLERRVTVTGTNFVPVVESYNPLPPQ